MNFKVKVKKLVKDYELTGELKSSFEKFGVEAPSIAGGLIAKVSPGLDLYFRINYSEIPSEVRGMD